jgi:hypothetical protein
MVETPQLKPGVAEKTSEQMGASHTAWASGATHRRAAAVVLIVLLILLQVVLVGIVVVQACRLVDLGERIERLERR